MTSERPDTKTACRADTGRRILSTLLLALTFAGSPSMAANVVVDSSADDTQTDGMCTLREALENNRLDAAVFSDCAGDASEDLITILPGLGPITLTERLEVHNPARIVGPSGGQVIRPQAGMTEQLIWVVPTRDGDYTIENLLLEDARHADFGATGSCTNRGGAMCVVSLFNDVDVVLRGLHFRNNQVTNLVPQNITGGGALYVRVLGNSSVRIENSIFQNNVVSDSNGDAASGYGGAILTLTPLRIASSLFVNNRVTSAPETSGGAIYSFGGRLTINGTTLSANGGAPTDRGSALMARLADVQLVDSFIEAHGPGIDTVRFEGAASGIQPSLLIANSAIRDNQARALTVTLTSNAFITNSTIAGNRVTNGLAGVFIDASELSVTGSTFADNVGLDGGAGAGTGAMRARDSVVRLDDTSLVGNDTFAGAGQAASGVELENSTLTARNTVLANTPFGEGNVWLRGSSVLNLSHSLLTPPDTVAEINGTNTGNVFDNVAAFGPLDDYGCSIRIGYLADRCVPMRPHSGFATSIIDVGASTSSFDQRGSGFARTYGSGPDIGASELQPPRVEFEPVAVALAEGTGGFTTFTFKVNRNGDRRGPTQADWEVFGNSAAPADPSDFDDSVFPFGTVFFDADEREKLVAVEVFGDGIAENDEGFRVVLQGITDGQPGDLTEAAATILNDDTTFPLPTLSISAIDTDRSEGDIFYSPHRFRVTRTQDTSGFCTYRLTVAGAGPDPIEANDLSGDWTLGTTGLSYQMAPGDTSNDIEVLIAGDSEAEGDEQFSVTLSDLSGCFMNQTAASAIGRVRNDDSLFGLQSVDAVLAEGDSGITEFRFRVQRSAHIDKTASVSWSVTGSGPTPADGADFDNGVLPAGSVNMAPGVTSLPITVRVRGDGQAEDDEDFRLQLGNPRSGGSIDPTNDFSIGTIIDDDDPDRLFKDGFE